MIYLTIVTALLFINCFLWVDGKSEREYDYGIEENERTRKLHDLFFPNRTIQTHSNDNFRKLQIKKTPYDGSVPCVTCSNLQVCSILNGFQVEELYYPLDLDLLESCKVIESLGIRIRSQLFGHGRTFRDTPQCKDIVMQYLCLFYGSNNPMYRNYCIFQEDVSDPNPDNHRVAPRPPCKSFCVQIATVCAQDPEFIQSCIAITCPPTQDDCTPDPIIDGQVLAANLGCQIPYDANPYRLDAGPTNAHTNFYVLNGLLVITCFILAQVIFI